jgi:hypothetical protein
LRRDFLEGARKKRFSYTFKGLWEAWLDLDAAMKVYVGSVAGLVLSVSKIFFIYNKGLQIKLIPTIILFFGSRRFHTSYGFFGEPATYFTCRRGFEW